MGSKQKMPSVPTSSSLYDQNNPAFRPTGLEGYPSSLSGHAAICKDPACRDPTCPTANYNAYLARLTLSSASGLPPGYLELLESYKMYSAAASGMRMPGLPPSLSPQDSQLAAYSQLLGGAGSAASLRGPYPSALSSLATSRYSPYPKPGYPSPHAPTSSSPLFTGSHGSSQPADGSLQLTWRQTVNQNYYFHSDNYVLV